MRIPLFPLFHGNPCTGSRTGQIMLNFDEVNLKLLYYRCRLSSLSFSTLLDSTLLCCLHQPINPDLHNLPPLRHSCGKTYRNIVSPHQIVMSKYINIFGLGAEIISNPIYAYTESDFMLQRPSTVTSYYSKVLSSSAPS